MSFFFSNGFRQAKQVWRWLEVIAWVLGVFIGFRSALENLLPYYGREAMLHPAIIANIYMYSAILCSVVYLFKVMIKRTTPRTGDFVSLMFLTFAMPMYFISILGLTFNVQEWEGILILSLVLSGEMLFYVPKVLRELNEHVKLPETAEEHTRLPESTTH